MLAPYDHHVINEVYAENVYRVNPTHGSRILDLGAHRGIFSVYCASKGANVTSYEPHPETFDDLVENIKINRLEKFIVPINAGVWNEAGEQELIECVGNAGGNSMHVGAGRRLKVPVVSLDQALGNQVWDIVKIDTEGSEYEILSGASNLSWSKIRYLTIEMHNWRDNQLYSKFMNTLRDNFRSVDGIVDSFDQHKRFNYIYCSR